jgi:hypothetical protein
VQATRLSATTRACYGGVDDIGDEPTGVDVDVADSPDPARHSSAIRTCAALHYRAGAGRGTV